MLELELLYDIRHELKPELPEVIRALCRADIGLCSVQLALRMRLSNTPCMRNGYAIPLIGLIVAHASANSCPL